jgi:hypothetical protein
MFFFDFMTSIALCSTHTHSTESRVLVRHHFFVKVGKKLRTIFFGLKTGITGGGKILHSEKTHNLYSSANIIKSQMMSWVGH